MTPIFHIFIALLIDIFSFTIILPLFPRLINSYKHDTLYLHLKQYLSQLRVFGIKEEFDIVLIGGMLGSLFAFLQFIVSPYIGRMSDKLGRKKTLLYTMVGNILSAYLWIFSSSFSWFLLSRIVAGLSEGNVQLSISMIKDLTSDKDRGKLALIGIAFALGFTFGPLLGAYLSNISLSLILPNFLLQFDLFGFKLGSLLTEFSTVALISTGLLLFETVYIILFIPETKTTHLAHVTHKHNNLFLVINFWYLFIFSGVEFTLTFLFFERFNYTNAQQGKTLALIGILSSVIQGYFVRKSKLSEHQFIVTGILSAMIACLCLSIVGVVLNATVIYCIFVCCFAYASGTVVNSLTGLYGGSGEDMGWFRSMGQLGRAIGPFVVGTGYWLCGSVVVYLVCGCFMGLVCLGFVLKSGNSDRKEDKKKI